MTNNVKWEAMITQQIATALCQYGTRAHIDLTGSCKDVTKVDEKSIRSTCYKNQFCWHTFTMCSLENEFPSQSFPLVCSSKWMDGMESKNVTQLHNHHTFASAKQERGRMGFEHPLVERTWKLYLVQWWQSVPGWRKGCFYSLHSGLGYQQPTQAMLRAQTPRGQPSVQAFRGHQHVDHHAGDQELLCSCSKLVDGYRVTP